MLSYRDQQVYYLLIVHHQPAHLSHLYILDPVSLVWRLLATVVYPTPSYYLQLVWEAVACDGAAYFISSHNYNFWRFEVQVEIETRNALDTVCEIISQLVQ
jgi:hypothetical protein